MSYQEKINKLNEICNNLNSETCTFINPSYKSALIGYTIENDQVKAVYSEEKILKELQDKNNWNPLEVQEWYEYNVLRALPHMKPSPIIIHTF